MCAPLRTSNLLPEAIGQRIVKIAFQADGVLIGTATAAPYSFTWSNVPTGNHTLSAVATDNLAGQTASATVPVISDAPPTISFTSPAANAVSVAPGSFTLTVDATSTTSSIAKVEFYGNDGTTNTLLGTAITAPYSITWANVPVGNYDLSAIATDGFGIATTSAAVAVSAIANVPPTVSLTGPANGTTMKVPGSFTLTADAISTTSAIAKVDFYAIDNATNAGTLIGTAIRAPYTANWSNVPLGDYTLSAVATDTLGAVTTSSQVSVTVNTGIAQAYYIHADHLDTPRQITDTAGNVVWQHDNSDPFGNNVPNENPSGQGAYNFNLRFPGQYFDKETGLHQNFHRDYDPNIGRYIESDPIGLEGGINTYTYVLGNPLSFVDPFGLRVLNPRNYRVSSEVMESLEELNRQIGCDKDILITGGDRDPSSNLGAGSTSTHTQGIAADISVPGQSHLETANQARESGIFGGVGWYEEGYRGPNGEGPHTHVDLRKSKTRWGYPAKGPRMRDYFPPYDVKLNKNNCACSKD